jgi:predicted Zn-ribbon and HTH transcriptional regulator
MAEPDPPPVRDETPRQRLRSLLCDAPLSARELSRDAGLAERDVLEHLSHLVRSLQAEGCELEVTPARCKQCGFRFEPRVQRARPGRCPECRSERIEAARFRIASGPR